MSDVGDILTSIKGLIAAIDGTGAYTVDLTDTDRVRIDDPPVTAPPLAPCVYVWIEDISSATSGANQHLGQYRRSIRVGYTGYVQSEANTVESRVLAAAALDEDVYYALEQTRQPGNNALGLSSPKIINFEIDSTTYQGALIAPTWSNYGVCQGIISIEYGRRYGGSDG